MPIITLTTDFGHQDPFTGIMKGVILGICPEARIVDLVHEIGPQDIVRASRVIADSFRFFPLGTVHVGVVDPGVGTPRRALVLETGGHVFVGPDNGIFTGVIRSGAGAKDLRAYALENPRYFLHGVSRTFHGRDVFAPAAAWIARGTPLEEFGGRVSGLVTFEEESAEILPGERITGRITGFDRFGNAETSITAKDLQEAFGTSLPVALYLSGHPEGLALVRSYSETAPGKGAALLNSSGRVEAFLYRRNIREAMGLEIGNQVAVERLKAVS